MRILHYHDAPRIHGGATAYLKQLLRESAARGCQNHLFCLDETPEGLEGLEGSDCFQYQLASSPLRRRLDFHSWHSPLSDSLEASIRRFEPDLVHLQNCGTFRTTVFPTIYKLGLPLLMTVHDFTLIDPNPFGLDRSGALGFVKQGLDRQSLAKARRIVFRHSTRFLCPTEALRNGVGFPPEKTQVQRLPIQAAEAQPLAKDRLRLFFAGTLFRSKGVDLLIEALGTSEHPGLQAATLEIAGTGDLDQELRAEVERQGLTSRVRFLGFCGPEEMDAAYQRANLQVLPSRVPENSPLTVLEAGARGRPSLASHAGGVPELLRNDRGWTFRSEDVSSLRQRLEEISEGLPALGERGSAMRNWVRKEFDPQRHWDGVESIYQELAR